MRRWIVLAMVIAAGCSSPTSGDSNRQPPQTPLVLTGTYTSSPLNGPGGATAVATGAGTMSLGGDFPEGQNCPLQLVFGGYRTPGRIVVQIYANSLSQVCGDLVSHVTYTAQVDSLPAGTYALDIQFPDNTNHWSTFQSDTVVVQ